MDEHKRFGKKIRKRVARNITNLQLKHRFVLGIIIDEKLAMNDVRYQFFIMLISLIPF